MKRKYLLLLTALMIITIDLDYNKAPEGERTIFDASRDRKYTDKITSIAEKNKVVGMTVLGYKNGVVRFVYNYGYSDINRKIKVDDNTIFLVASITKVITGMAIMKLVETRKIMSIDDDISIYLKYKVRNPKYPDLPITIKHLMTHTSGLTDGGVSRIFFHASFSKNPPSMREALLPSGKFYNSGIWMDSKPGEIFEYSNFGAVLVGSIIGKVSGMRYDEYVNQNIIDPLEMRGGLTIDKVKNINRVAVIYRLDGSLNPYPRIDKYNGRKPSVPDFSGMIPGRNPMVFGPQGGLRTRIRGLEKIMEVFMNDGICYSTERPVRILDKETIDLMLKTYWRGYGFDGLYKKKGLFIHITDDLIPGVKMYGHKGDAFGLMSDMYFSPSLDFGIVLIMNGGHHVKGESGFYIVEEQIMRSAYQMLFKKD
jgi:CubicO group peptidase (beta-lactamase class C family)